MGKPSTGNEGSGALWTDTGSRNRRTVWTVPTRGCCPSRRAPWRTEAVPEEAPVSERRLTTEGILPEEATPFGELLLLLPRWDGEAEVVGAVDTVEPLPDGSADQRTAGSDR